MYLALLNTKQRLCLAITRQNQQSKDRKLIKDLAQHQDLQEYKETQRIVFLKRYKVEIIAPHSKPRSSNLRRQIILL